MTQRKLMQYNHEQDDLVRTMPVDQFEKDRVAVALVGDADRAVQYAQVHRDLGKSEVVVFRSVNYDLKEEIALYNALRRMEVTNPSISRIQDEFNLNAGLVGIVVGRDVTTNQPIFYENRVLESDSRFKAYLDEKLGSVIEPRFPVGRALFIGSPELLGQYYMGTSAGRLVGVIPEVVSFK